VSSEAPFMQIAVVSGTAFEAVADERGNLQRVPMSKITLVALDDDGDVWTYEGAEDGWKMLSMKRQVNAEDDR